MTAALKTRPKAAPARPLSPLHRIAARLDEVPAAARKRLVGAGDALADGDFARAESLAAAALPEGGSLALRLIGLTRERAGALPQAFEALREAHLKAPADPDGVRDLARLARRMGQPALAADLLARVRAAAPGDLADAQDLAAVLRDLDRCDEALAIVREAMADAPQAPHLWSLLGSIAAQKGDDADARVFHDEALRLAPRDVPILANAALARLDVGDASAAKAACDAALAAGPTPPQAAAVRLARATARLCLGDLGGWEDYAARLAPERREALAFDIAAPRWTPARPLAGLSLMLVGEQGLGDEVMFGSMIGDALVALGPAGRLTLAVEPRLVPLLARAWPAARVIGHATASLAGRLRRTVPDAGPIQAWAPIGDLLPLLRGTPESFAGAKPFLAPDPARVAHWRIWLESLGPGRKVGILWRSGLMAGLRARRFAPFEAWTPVLATSGAVFVNLQYGEAEPDLARAQALGLAIHRPPGLDLMQDLEGVAALACALDMMIGPMTATSNLAAACGVETWILASNPSWPLLGTTGCPWYSNARAFTPDEADDWAPRLEGLARALAQRLNDMAGALAQRLGLTPAA
ncbi:flagellar protein FlbA [Caulobacter flavus]|uniref:Flagellar protein FlbA n=1 Tax=Caulobacter flavus TaxID=1679497 RepID=A0A2N5CSY5_9CAUL|nr:flagellar protein FlbA [Caulobacter flavus]AYV49117.1 flagellar protein FlbA [Caulobacter flavus]PLR14762.1 flagellar protein FlbA [Caulobacter flavus]